MSRFPTHGSVELDIDDNILLVEGSGPWNLESVVESETHMAPLLALLSGKPWGALVVLHGDPIYVPDAAAFLSKAVRAQKALGRVATAMVVDQSNTPEFSKRHIGQLLDEAGENYRFFPDKAQAKWWLVQQIIQASH
ncbi:hypothetical protein [Paraglaciecola polaris]|uniref:STAS/SEC14 domain-containing protein n=1 Tax=Paraglaciecola polaris LMG 21857 TaxID=1129793 RepID=K6ZZ01_9ALTE|nr:hypothetical protein [Paraglaciecola polaris]GAC35422.1 hypothetical protein GPLA_4547 [Paraglaciecola polaris LMG 21857]